MEPRRRRGLALVTLAASGLSCNQLLGIEGASVGCISDAHCGPAESCLASVCESLRPADAGPTDAGDAATDARR